MTAALSPDDFDELHDFIKVQVAAGYASADDIVADAVELFEDSTLDQAGLHGAARTLTDRAVTAHATEQVGWPGETDCDRLDAVFTELAAAGIVARQHFSCCATCGADEIRDEMDRAEKLGQTVRGFTFFHMQDTQHAVGGESLYLSYGAADRDKDSGVAIGHEVVAVLGRHGLAPAWNGKHAHRIALPIQWQRRRP